MKKERLPTSELDPDLLTSYADTFISRWDMYPIQLGDSRYVSVKKKLNLQLVDAHLRGHITLGAYALSQDHHAKWICFDADDESAWIRLIELSGELITRDVPTYLEPSRRGGHLWLFTHPLPGSNIRRFGQRLLAEHFIEDVELFPKQDRLVTGPGSLVRLPLGIHRKNGRRYHFVTLTGKPLAPTIRDQVRLLASPRLVPEPFVSQILDRTPPPVEVPPTPVFPPPADEVQGETLSERIKNAISVYDFVSQYVDLDERGRGLCPFHDDHHKSFGVNISEDFWHCFACGIGGSAIDFWSAWRKHHGKDPDFVPTIKDLADMLL
jgi:hypothetical protein